MHIFISHISKNLRGLTKNQGLSLTSMVAEVCDLDIKLDETTTTNSPVPQETRKLNRIWLGGIRTLTIILIIGGIFLLTGCGNDSEDTATPSSTIIEEQPSPETPLNSPTPNYFDSTISSEIDEETSSSTYGCALNGVNSFDLATVDTIYFVVNAKEITADMLFSLQIKNHSGGLVAQDPDFWTSDANDTDICIFYGINAETTGGFYVGTFDAILLADRVEVARTEFTITEE